ncbi:MAG: hypothetical protein EB126_06890 [Synechococcaceae bacterium WBB_10_009]|nr:hypothetical protein [Synechococcaceae bacterium WBB_10_009]
MSRHDQAEALRSALEQRQLPSRLVSRGDVFESLGAAALQRLLDALASPGLPNRQRLLAASALLGWSAAEIAAAPPERWDALALQLADLASRLPRQGLTAVLGQLLGTAGLARLSLRGRALADLQQAAELVQEQMHRQGLGAAAAADWLRRLRLEEQRDPPEEHLCRSDAAESAIAVVTVHRSKGLEYPVVICPHLWRAPKPARSGAQRLGRRWTPPGQAQPRLDLHLNPHWGPGRAAAAQHQGAQLQEAERLAYVACTRAQHLLVLGWPGEQRAEPGNPLTPWLAQADLPLHPIDAAALPPPGRPWRPPSPQEPLQLGPRPSRSLDSRWGRASYSAWAHAQAPLAPQTRDEGRDSDGEGLSGDELPAGDLSAGERSRGEPTLTKAPSAAPSTNPGPALGPLAHFPRGAGPGDVLHRILERLDYPALAAGDLSPPPCCRRSSTVAAWRAAGRSPCSTGCCSWCRPPWGGRWGAAVWGISAPAAGSTSSTSTCPWRCPPTAWCAAAAWRRCSATTPAAASAPPMASSCASWRWPAAASSPAPSTWCSATASAGGWPTGRATGWGAAMARGR